MLTEAPVDITGDLSSVEVMEKDDATFTCELSKPGQKVTWQVSGKKVKPSDKYEMISDGKVRGSVQFPFTPSVNGLQRSVGKSPAGFDFGQHERN